MKATRAVGTLTRVDDDDDDDNVGIVSHGCVLYDWRLVDLSQSQLL